MKQKRGLKNLIEFNLLNLGLMVLITVSIPLISAGNVTVKEGKLSIDNDFSVNTNNLFVNTSVVRVGIGTNLPTQLLDVRGNINVSNEVYVKNGTAIGPWLYNQSTATYNMYNSQWSSTYNSTYSQWTYNQTTTAISYVDTQGFVKNGSNVRLNSLNISGEIVTGLINISGTGGKVGIGTVSPSAKLTISQPAYTGTPLALKLYVTESNGSANNPVSFGELQFHNQYISNSIASAIAGTIEGANIRGGLDFIVNNANNLNTVMRINYLGNIGIGTNSSTHKVTILGNVNVSNEIVTGLINISGAGGRVGIGTTSPAYLLETAVNSVGANLSGVLYVNGTSESVGVGTSTPTQNLDVVGTAILGSGGNRFTFGVLASDFIHYDNEAIFGLASDGGVVIRADADNDDNNGFFAVQDYSGGYRLYVNTSSGDVGIGTSTPTDRLTVSGNVYVTLNVSAQGFVDRSTWCNINESNAISALMNINGKTDGSIDKDTIPTCAVVQVTGLDEQTNQSITEKGRDIGAYISYLTIVAQEQQKEISSLKQELCKKNNNYGWC